MTTTQTATRQTLSLPHMLWLLLRQQPWRYAAGELLPLSFFLAGRLAFSLLLQVFFNRLQQQSGPDLALWLLPFSFILAALTRAILGSLGNRALVTALFKTTQTLRHNILKRILERPGARPLPGSTGEAISGFRDDIEIFAQLFSRLLNVFALTCFTSIALVIMLHTSVRITLFVFLPLLCVVIIAQSMKKRLEKYRVASRAATAEVTGAIGEIFGSVQAIQVAGAEERVTEHFSHLNKRRHGAMVQDSVLSAALNSLFGNTVGIGIGAILILAAIARGSEHLSVGDIALFISFLGNITNFVQSIGTLLAQVTQTRVSLTRLRALLQGAPDTALVAPAELYLQHALPQITLPAKYFASELHILQAHNLSYHYPDTGRGITGINLEIKGNTLTVITGRMGSGKTTLLRTLLGLLSAEAGAEITWNGVKVAEPASFFVPPHCAYTPQVPHLFSDTLRENILLGLPASEEQLYRAIQNAVMEEDVIQLEAGLETIVGIKGVKLSGGQVQRSAAARMLVRPAQLLVFDDLSSALDVATEARLWERLFSEEQHTYLVVSHRRAILQRANQVIVLKEGHIEACGRLEEVLDQSSEMRYLWLKDEIE
ncbi:HlyB/MsbA family ABC transporter [Ktedonobacter sp. SOSP1-52]|uniref:ATP-binding cassette domain-containing protein n=1 Tax=Ktedonobacter sp. SOSP1-52 TaxID=2778366 RepID=UPI0019163E15|nr:ABC transporter ATP-binding protein [Ktedonobacter sp. SOSP1-52]GHO70916.1 HlyB/MsbA family ABC transporter [Ktedonobacter sp. SOSP1-52]